MRAFVLTAPRQPSVQEVAAPAPEAGEAVIDVERAGVCGTGVEFFTGDMAYLHDGHARYPMRLGHEWAGTVSTVGEGVDPAWIGRRVIGDTMLGDGACRRCRKGSSTRLREPPGGWNPRRPPRGAGTTALRTRVLPAPAARLRRPAPRGAVQPGGNALRAAHAAELRPGDRALVLGPGTIGLLVAMFARAAGAEVHLTGRPGQSTEFVRGLGFASCWTEDTLPDLPFDALIDASDAEHLRALALAARSILGRSWPPPSGLEQVGSVLAGQRPPGAGRGPKIHVDPRIV